MPNIRKLLPHEIQQIAAGEVVERPASIVKELVENSIDASATHICIHAQNGGKDLISISDNGIGMSKENAYLALQAHTTSKLLSIQSLMEGIETKGFRGEALSSIASVSDIILKTKQKSAECGISITSTPGNSQYIVEDCTCEPGTHITITNLFESIPARRKFLKSKETEWNAILTLVQHISFAYPHISFTLKHNEKTIYDVTSSTSLYERALQIVPPYTNSHMIECLYNDGYIKIEGALSNYEFGTYDRSWILLHVNKRNIKQHKLTQAVVRGYQDGLQARKYPCALLSIELDPEHVDVNVHPRKEEVAFIHPKKVELAITQATKQALERFRQSLITEPLIDEFSSKHTPAEISIDTSKKDEDPLLSTQQKDYEDAVFQAASQDSFNIKKNIPKVGSHVHDIDTNIEELAINTSSKKENPKLLPEVKTEYTSSSSIQRVHQKYLGVYAKTYLLFERSDGLVLIDQHALHERIIYERLKNHVTEVNLQPLISPFIYNTDKQTVATVEKHSKLLMKAGLDISSLNETTLALRAVMPMLQKKANLKELIESVIVTLKNQINSTKDISDILLHDIRASIACRSAVMAGDTLTENQISELTKEAGDYECTSLCPHGRPTSILLTQYEIEKLFKRKI